jgi:NAD(P)-dependent dehydrogenase (short-subunit alcohol dehydrogenase family)
MDNPEKLATYIKGTQDESDHSKDSDVEQLFDRVSREQDGRLDVLVNNAYSAVKVVHLYYINTILFLVSSYNWHMETE